MKPKAFFCCNKFIPSLNKSENIKCLAEMWRSKNRNTCYELKLDLCILYWIAQSILTLVVIWHAQDFYIDHVYDHTISLYWTLPIKINCTLLLEWLNETKNAVSSNFYFYDCVKLFSPSLSIIYFCSWIGSSFETSKIAVVYKRSYNKK